MVNQNVFFSTGKRNDHFLLIYLRNLLPKKWIRLIIRCIMNSKNIVTPVEAQSVA